MKNYGHAEKKIYLRLTFTAWKKDYVTKKMLILRSAVILNGLRQQSYEWGFKAIKGRSIMNKDDSDR